MQDPNGPLGSLISSCGVCQCTCAVGPLKNSDREDLYNAYEEHHKKEKEYPSVSEHRETGLDDFNEMARNSLQV